MIRASLRSGSEGSCCGGKGVHALQSLVPPSSDLLQTKGKMFKQRGEGEQTERETGLGEWEQGVSNLFPFP